MVKLLKDLWTKVKEVIQTIIFKYKVGMAVLHFNKHSKTMLQNVIKNQEYMDGALVFEFITVYTKIQHYYESDLDDLDLLIEWKELLEQFEVHNTNNYHKAGYGFRVLLEISLEKYGVDI